MCRLSATTLQGLGDLPLELMHEMMVRGSWDEGGQKDGWGMSDGNLIVKDTRHYAADIPSWKKVLSPERFMIGHVRKMSTGTGRTAHENHPYRFDINGQTMIAAHNGWIEGTPWEGWQSNNPQTDSWRALNILATTLQDRNLTELTPELVEEWLANFQVGSHYVFLILLGDSLYAIRGNSRTLHLLESKHGWLLHTSVEVLYQMKEYLIKMHGIETGKVLRLGDNQFVRFGLGDAEPDFREIKPVFKTKVYRQHTTPANNQQYTGQYGGAASQTPKENSVSTNVAGSGTSNGNDQSGDDFVIAPRVTPPRRRVITPPPPVENKGDISERRKKWIEICGRMSPLRSTLTRYYAAIACDYLTFDNEPDINFLRKASIRELELIADVMAPIDSTGEIVKPFTPVAMIMINWWNHAVNVRHDLSVQKRIFGNDIFWLDSDYVVGDPTTCLMLWQKNFLITVMERCTEAEIRQWFNAHVLKSTLDSLKALHDIHPNGAAAPNR